MPSIGDTQSDHALAVARYGDLIFDIVQEGAKELETSWKKAARGWDGLIDSAVKGGWLDRLFRDPIDRKWISFLLFQPTRMWPKELSDEERKLLELLRAVSAYNPLHDQGVDVDRAIGVHTDPSKAETEKATLKALKALAELTKKGIGFPMWKAYNSISEQKAREIVPLCMQVYSETCTHDDAVGMFQGDLERGWRVKTLRMDPATYQVFPKFLDWIAA